MYKYVYINKITGVKVYSNEPIERDDLELVSEIKNGVMTNYQTT